FERLLLRGARHQAYGAARRLYRRVDRDDARGQPRHLPRRVAGQQGGRLAALLPPGRRAARRRSRLLDRQEGGMMTYAQLRTALARMEESLAQTRHNLALVERRLCDGAEAETIRRRPKSRWYHRRMSRWTGA